MGRAGRWTAAEVATVLLAVSTAASTPAAPQQAPPSGEALVARAAAARARLEKLLPLPGAGKAEDRLTPLAVEHERAAEAARAFCLDTKLYPTPEKALTSWTPGRDRQPGHAEMEMRVSGAIVAHNRFAAALSAAMKSAPEPVGERKLTAEAWTGVVPKIARYGLSSARPAFETFLAAYGKAWKDYRSARQAMAAESVADTDATSSRPLLEALGALAEGRHADAAAAAGALRGLEKQFHWQARAYALLDWNRANLHGHAPAEAKAVELINVYRIALGVAPLTHHPKLHAMARDFAVERGALSARGHEHPTDEERRTKEDRAKRVGYDGVAGENCSGVGDPVDAVWRWRTDAGHHRGMMDPAYRVAGLGAANHCVLNTGWRAEGPAVLFDETAPRAPR